MNRNNDHVSRDSCASALKATRDTRILSHQVHHGRSLYNSQFGHPGTEIAYNQESLHHNSVQINRLYLPWAAQEPPSAFIPHLSWIANYGANIWDYNQVSPCDGTSNTCGYLPYQGIAYQPTVVVSLLEQIPWKGTNTQQLKAGPNSCLRTVSLPDVNNEDWISGWSMDERPYVYPLAVGQSPTGC
ncbi:hypothetical protein KCU81_g10107, partial [Aureobasidium melanogenum]|uniref:Uncharacterized protein n=1 Tax=Aureobasidium melanogenum (strain CBS 110374) TaxID=1043003 RepID=A0A074VIN7_AURM1